MNEGRPTIDQFLGAAIRSARFSRGMTQGDLAVQLGLTRATIASYETGRRKVPADTLIHIAHLCGKPLAFFDPLEEDQQHPGDPPEKTAVVSSIDDSALQTLLHIFQLRPDIIPMVLEFVEAWLGQELGDKQRQVLSP